MYIHKQYLLQNDSTDIKEYKKELKKLSSINLRRSSKLNILAILGSIKCMQNTSFSDNMGIYIASEYGSISSVKKVLEQISQDDIVMPFDFLNINSNNVSFYVSQALNSTGKNMVITSHDLSFEKALDMAIFDLEQNEIDDILIGDISESLEDIENYNIYISNVLQKNSKDTSFWLYINKIEENSIAKINDIYYFEDIETLNKKIKTLEYQKVSLNQYATLHSANIELDEKKIFESKTNNIHAINKIHDFLENEEHSLIHIAMDKNKKGYLIEFKK